jgi:hypothetical protein
MTELKTLSRLSWGTYPIRRCRSLHHCEICSKDIRLGDVYRDGGYSRRAHVRCTSAVKSTDGTYACVGCGYSIAGPGL